VIEEIKPKARRHVRLEDAQLDLTLRRRDERAAVRAGVKVIMVVMMAMLIMMMVMPVVVMLMIVREMHVELHAGNALSLLPPNVQMIAVEFEFGEFPLKLARVHAQINQRANE